MQLSMAMPVPRTRHAEHGHKMRSMFVCRKCVDANSRENDTNRVIDSLVEILTNYEKKVSPLCHDTDAIKPSLAPFTRRFVCDSRARKSHIRILDQEEVRERER